MARRRTVVVLGCAVLGIAVALMATLFVWITQRYGTDRSLSLSRKGYQVNSAVLPLALAALAGLAASFAGRGWVRRIVGLAIALAGVTVVVLAVGVLVDPPADATSGDAGLPAAPNLMGPVEVAPLGPILLIAGGILIAAAGAGILAGIGVRRLGTRYDPPSKIKAEVAAGHVSADVSDADAAAHWWKALDSGADPTAMSAGDTPAGTSGEAPGNPAGVQTGAPSQLP